VSSGKSLSATDGATVVVVGHRRLDIAAVAAELLADETELELG
jgi:hypothetical protein